MVGEIKRTHTTRVRVRYSEVDRMGLLYHVNHLEYFEVARSDWIRSLWRSYRNIEDEGYFLIVVEARLNYMRPAYYDEELLVEISLSGWGKSRLTFSYLIRREDDEQPICTGETVHCFTDSNGKVLRMPDDLRKMLGDS